MMVEEFALGYIRITEGNLSVHRAGEGGNFIVREYGEDGKVKEEKIFRDAVRFDKYMRKVYGELGDLLVGLLCWYFYDLDLCDDEIDYLKENNQTFKAKWEEFLRIPD